jgi:hypothetical protein
MRPSKLLASFIFATASFCNVVHAEVDLQLTDFKVWAIGSEKNIRVTLTSSVSPANNPAGCTDPDSFFVLSTMAAETQSRIYATLLAARIAEKPVWIRINGCELNRPAIIAAYL